MDLVVFINNNINWYFKEKLNEEFWLLIILIRVVGDELFIVGILIVWYFREFDRLSSYNYWLFIVEKYVGY